MALLVVVARWLVSVGFVALLLTACAEKDIVPVTDFGYELADQDLKSYLSVYPVGEAIKLTNTSTNGVSYEWNFGNGTRSEETDPTVSYDKSGTYTITLTATNGTGKQDVATKTITIVDRILKKITVNTLNWNAFGSLPSWQGNKRADLTVAIGQRLPNDSPIVVSTVLYRSAPVTQVTNTSTAFTVPVSQKVVLNPQEVSRLIVALYGNDGNDNPMVYSSGGSGIGYRAYLDKATRQYTIVSASLGTALTLECDYE